MGKLYVINFDESKDNGKVDRIITAPVLQLNQKEKR